MHTISTTFATLLATSGHVNPASGSAAAWMIAQVFAVFFITFAGLWWLTERKT